MADNRVLSITIVAPSEKAARELAKIGDAAEGMGFKVGQSGEKVARAGEHTEQMGHKTSQAFNAVQSAATSVGASLGPVGEIVEHFTVNLERGEASASRMHRTLQVMGAAAAAVGGIIAIESSQDQAALAQLEVAVDNAGKKWADYREELEKAAAQQAKNGHSDNDAVNALTTLTTALNDPKEAIERLGLVADVAARQKTNLATAAKTVASVVAGNMRALREWGINVKDIVDPTAEAAAATKQLAGANATLSTATQNLNNFEANLNAQRQAGAAAHAERVQQANDKLAQAEQHLTDVQQSAAQQRQDAKDRANEKVTSSTQKLSDANETLADTERQIHEATQLSLQDAFSLRDAREAVSDVQQKIANGELAGAAAAQALRDAQQRLADTTALQAEKTKVSAEQAAKLRDAQQGAARAASEHADAVGAAKTAGGETTAQHNANRDALAGVADAHDAVAKAQASGSGGETLKQLQEERKLREELAKATGAQHVATSRLEAAKKAEAEFGTKVQAALRALDDKVHGSAEAQAHTVEGMFKHFIASTQNAFSSLGPSIGFGLVAASAALQIFLALSSTAIFTTIADVVGAMAVGALAGAEAMLPLLVTWAPLIAGIALVGAAVYLLWKHWDQIWGWIKTAFHATVGFIKEHIEWIIAVAFGPFGVAIKLIKDHWDSIWGAIKTSASSVAGFFQGAFSTVEGIVLSPFRAVISIVNDIIDMIDGIHFSFHAPSWLGGWGWEFKGFGIPKIPTFADGGIVPGAMGEPTLILAHGGEEVRNPAQMRSGGPRGAATHFTVDVNVHGALLTDAATARKIGLAVADGVHDGFLQKQQRQPLGLTGR